VGPEPVSTSTKSSASSVLLGYRTRRTRISAAWVGIIVGALVLVLLLVFILHNTRTVKISYFTATGTMPLGVALLLAAIAGVCLPASLPHCGSGSYVTAPPEKGNPPAPLLSETSQSPKGRPDRAEACWDH
jgi:uncharacterized integral membrane protein